MSTFDYSTESKNQLVYRSISPKAVLIFPKNFLGFRLDTIEQRGFLKLSNYNSNSYAFVVLSDSEVTSLEEARGPALYPLLCCAYFIFSCIIGDVSFQISLFPFLRYSVKACMFSVFFFQYSIKFFFL